MKRMGFRLLQLTRMKEYIGERESGMDAQYRVIQEWNSGSIKDKKQTLRGISIMTFYLDSIGEEEHFQDSAWQEHAFVGQEDDEELKKKKFIKQILCKNLIESLKIGKCGITPKPVFNIDF